MSNPKGAELLAQAASRMRADFEAIRATVPHQGEKGREAQETLITFLNKHLPKRFMSTSGFAVDTTGAVSRHLDVLIYDHLDAMDFSPADNTVMVPNDNVGAVIEVKSTLNKRALTEAADQIAHAKSLQKAPEIETDYPMSHSAIQLTYTRGTVFAYTSDTSLDTLWSNLQEINAATDSDLWVDDVIVLDKGLIRYATHFPYVDSSMLWGGAPPALQIVPPMYVVPNVWEDPDMALPAFMASLSNHLAHYRRRPTLPIAFLLPSQGQGTARQGYWFTTTSKLVPVPLESTKPADGSKLNPAQRITFLDGQGKPVGKAEWFGWADGHVFAFMLGRVPAVELILSAFLKPYNVTIRMHTPAPGLELTQVLPGAGPAHLEHAIRQLDNPSMPFRLKVESFGKG